jgi:hypothetical protein
VAAHGSLDGRELTDAEDRFWRKVYATRRKAGDTPDEAIVWADNAVRDYRDAQEQF